MIIVGSKNSSNTTRLYEISKNNCAHVFFVDSIEDMIISKFQSFSKIGISSGASVPEYLVTHIVGVFEREGFKRKDFGVVSLDDDLNVLEISN
jgi:4-hydroxy-3-methylbut-2-enyl diphosphate reductase IspH